LLEARRSFSINIEASPTPFKKGILAAETAKLGVSV
jgi:hypothetical protein